MTEQFVSLLFLVPELIFQKKALKERAPAGWCGEEDREKALGLLSPGSRGQHLRCPRQSPSAL